MATKKITSSKQKNAGAMRHLKKVDAVLHKAALHFHTVLNLESSRKHSRNALFAALASSVTSQQLSTKAADTIWGRVKIACGDVTPETIEKMPLPKLRACGLSRAKVKTLKELARALQKGNLDLLALKRMPEEEAIETLSAVWGIGRWTAEMFLMFPLARTDIFSSSDLGLVRAMETLYQLPKGTAKAVLEQIACAWSPHRTFASRILWLTRDTKP